MLFASTNPLPLQNLSNDGHYHHLADHLLQFRYMPLEVAEDQIVIAVSSEGIANVVSNRRS
jgi:hypothetical protein